MTDQDVIYQGRLHWIIFLFPSILFFIASYITLVWTPLRSLATILFSLIVLWYVFLGFTWSLTSLTIRKKNVSLRTGILIRNMIDLQVSKIESIDVRQSLLGCVFHYGSLIIKGTGGTNQVINYVAKPLTCRRYIEQQMHHTT